MSRIVNSRSGAALIFALALVFNLTCLVIAPARAYFVNFTASGFNPGENSSSITRNLGGYQVTVEVVAPVGASLFWSGVGHPDAYRFLDGFGINGGPLSYQADEIEGPEILRVRFATPVNLYSIQLTNLFVEGSPSYLEQGFYSLNGSAPVAFLADPNQRAGSVNDGLRILTGFSPSSVSQIDFTAPGRINGQSHEFSLAGLDIGFAVLPGPATLLLLGMGLVGVWFMTRRRDSA